MKTKRKTNMLNEYFASILTDKPEITSPLVTMQQEANHILNDMDISPVMVREKLMN